MAYCSEDEILKMIPQEELAKLTAESGEVPDSLVIADAIDKADAEIDSYAGVRYIVPMSPVPAQVKTLSVDLAIYHLYSRRSIVPAVRQQKYEAAVAILKRVAAGQMILVGPSGELPTAAKEVADSSGAIRVFSRNTLADW